MPSTSLVGTRTPLLASGSVESQVGYVQPYFVQQLETIIPEQFLECLRCSDGNDLLPSEIPNSPVSDLALPADLTVASRRVVVVALLPSSTTAKNSKPTFMNGYGQS